jgi:hypothetical protein
VLRRRVTAGLNKGEARKFSARAAFFHRLGDIRDSSYKNQRYRASGLNLVVAAITLWNTVYLERVAAAYAGNARSTTACSPISPRWLEPHQPYGATTSGTPTSASRKAASGPSAGKLQQPSGLSVQ